MSRIAQTLSAEQGKTLADAEGDVFRGLEVVEHAARSARCSSASSPKTWPRCRHLHHAPAHWVCVGISPFNFPAMIPLWMFPMAIVCGNTFVLKPPSRIHDAHAARGAGAASRRPAGRVQHRPCGKRSVEALCTHRDVAAVSFVGSTTVGTLVYNMASQHGKRVQCMMGARITPWSCRCEQGSRLERLVGATSARPAALHGDFRHRAGREAKNWIPDIVAKPRPEGERGTEKARISTGGVEKRQEPRARPDRRRRQRRRS